MKFSLKPHQLVAHWVPGFVFLLFVRASDPLGLYGMVEPLLPREEVSRGILWVVLAFAAGQLIDCLRNVFFEGFFENAFFEKWRKKKQKVNWDFFFTGCAQSLENLDRWFFEYYVFDVNLAVPSLCFFLWWLVHFLAGVQTGSARFYWVQSLVGLVVLFVVFVLFRDALSLRDEIAKHTNSPSSDKSTQS